jgi:hypothetical protein
MAWRIFPALHHFYLENQEHVRHTLSYLVFSFIQGLVKWKRSVVIYHRLLHFLVLTMFFLWNSCIYFLVFHPCDYVLYTVLLLPVGGFVCWIMVYCVFSSVFFCWCILTFSSLCRTMLLHPWPRSMVQSMFCVNTVNIFVLLVMYLHSSYYIAGELIVLLL